MDCSLQVTENGIQVQYRLKNSVSFQYLYEHSILGSMYQKRVPLFVVAFTAPAETFNTECYQITIDLARKESRIELPYPIRLSWGNIDQLLLSRWLNKKTLPGSHFFCLC